MSRTFFCTKIEYANKSLGYKGLVESPHPHIKDPPTPQIFHVALQRTRSLAVEDFNIRGWGGMLNLSMTGLGTVRFILTLTFGSPKP